MNQAQSIRTPLRGAGIRTRRLIREMLAALGISVVTFVGMAGIVGLWYLLLGLTQIESIPGATSLFGSSVVLFFVSIFTLPFFILLALKFVEEQGWRRDSRVKAAQRRQSCRTAKQGGQKLKAQRLATDFVCVAEELMSVRGIDPLRASVLAHEALALLEKE